MAETKKEQIIEKKSEVEKKEVKPINSHTSDNKFNKIENEVEKEMEKEVKTESKMQEEVKPQHSHTSDNNKVKTEEKKPEKKVIKKEEAVARGVSLPLSKKHSMYICSFIKNKNVDTAIKELNEVLLFKRAIPFKGEIPHRHDLGMMSGRYPIKAVKHIIQVLKGLRGNILANGMDLEKSKFYIASANWASRPARRGGMRFKRAHVILKAKEMEVKENKKQNKKIRHQAGDKK